MNDDFKPKGFWQKPEGVTGAIFLLAAIAGVVFLVASGIGAIVSFATTTLGLAVTIAVLGLLIYMTLDSKARTLFSYMYKSTMRWITGLFVQIDPIAILKNYVDDMTGNLKKMNKQIIQLRGQMHKLKELILNNQKEISANLTEASVARDTSDKSVMILKSRKAGRLKESNMKYEDLHRKMELLYRVLKKMYENSSILKEDVADQVELKEQEMKAIKASHSAMASAMSVIRGDKDKKAMFEMALEQVTEDVSAKVGEMERFMEMSESFMNSIDLKNGIFEEAGLKMLEQWEKEGSLLLMDEKDRLLLEENSLDEATLDINQPVIARERVNQYDNLFEL